MTDIDHMYAVFKTGILLYVAGLEIKKMSNQTVTWIK